MFKFLKSITSPLLSLAIVMVAVGLFSTFVPLRLTLDGYSPFIIGSATSAYFAGLVIGSVRTEKFIASVGHIRTFAAFASITCAISIIMGMKVDAALWISMRFLMGFFTSGLFIVIESWLLMVGGKDKKGTILSFYMIAFYAAQSGGQFLLNVASPESHIPFSLASLFIALSVVPVALTKHKSPSLDKPSLLSPLKLFKISAYGITSAFSSGLIMGAFFGLAPVFAHSVGMGTSEVARYMGYTILGGFILQWPIGRLSDILNRRSVISGVSFITAILGMLIALASHISVDILYILSIIFGGLSFTMYPLSISYTNDFLDPKDLIAATGGLLLSYGVGCVIGPMLAPVVMSVLGPAGLYIYFSFIAMLVGLMGIMKVSRKKEPPHSHMAYRSIPRTTPKISELDPRAEDESKKLMSHLDKMNQDRIDSKSSDELEPSS